MGKAKLGVLLAGAYALGLAILVAVALALPAGTLCWVRPALASVPQQAQRVAQVARVAVHAGQLGMKHLPAVLVPQGAASHRRTLRFCTREQSGGCGSGLVFPPLGTLRAVAPVLVNVVFTDSEE
ncbi:MAG: hypothetical protein ACLPJH_17045 [Myxococcaceae bacterium]